MCPYRHLRSIVQILSAVWEAVTETAMDRKQREYVRRFEASRPYQRCQIDRRDTPTRSD